MEEEVKLDVPESHERKTKELISKMDTFNEWSVPIDLTKPKAPRVKQQESKPVIK